MDIGNKKIGITYVGGGAMTNTYCGRWVLRNGELAQVHKIYRSGHLACSTSQAEVEIKEGDVVIEVYGHKPVDIENITIIECTKFEGGEWKETETPENFIPEKVKRGMSMYHNRDGGFFVK